MKHKLKILLKDDFFRHISIMVVGTGLVNFFNLVYQLVLVRFLSSTQYGTLNSLVSLFIFFMIFVGPLRATLTKFLSGYFSHKEFDKTFFVLRHIFKRLAILSFLFLTIFVLFKSQLAGFLQIEESYYLMVIGLIVTLAMLAPVFQSFLQSSQVFKSLAFVGVVSVISKVVLGSGLIYFGFGVLGGLLGYLAVPIVVIGLDIFLVYRYCKAHNINLAATCPVEIAPIYRYFLPTSLAMLSFTALTNIDVILVKHFFSPLEAGYYSVAQIVGKIILFLPSAVSVVIFPKAAALHANNQEGIHLLKKGLVMIALSCGLLAAICIVFPESVLKVLTSKTDSESIKLIGLFALSMSFYALVKLINFFHLSRHNTRFVLPICILAIAQALTIYFFHPSLESVLYILLSFSVLSFLVGLFMLRYERK